MKVVQFQIVGGTLYRLYEDGTITSCYQGDAGILETAVYPVPSEVEAKAKEMGVWPTPAAKGSIFAPLVPDEVQPDKEVDE